MDELLARMRAAVRRAQPNEDAPVIITETFTIDLAAKRVTRDEKEVRLTPTEWHLLEVLTRHPGRLVTGKALLQEVWSPAHGTETNYLRVYMAHSVAKLGRRPPRTLPELGDVFGHMPADDPPQRPRPGRLRTHAGRRPTSTTTAGTSSDTCRQTTRR